MLSCAILSRASFFKSVIVECRSLMLVRCSSMEVLAAFSSDLVCSYSTRNDLLSGSVILPLIPIFYGMCITVY